MTNASDIHYPVLEATMDAVVQFVRKHGHKLSALRELGDMDPAEISAIARDLGVTPSQLRAYTVEDPELPKQLEALLSALGVKPESYRSADNTLTRDMPTVCHTCGEKKQCSHELAAGTAAQNFRDFCPNAPSIESLVEQQTTAR